MWTWLDMGHMPSVPKHFTDRAHALAQQHDLPDMLRGNTWEAYYTRQVANREGETVLSRNQESRNMGEDWAEWVRNNIMSECIETACRVSRPVSNVHGPHTDPDLKWKLYYMLEHGGDAAITRFYRIPDQPVVLDHTPIAIVHNDVNTLEILEEIRWPKERWILLNTSILHGVEHIESLRYNLTVSCKPQDLRNFYWRS